MTVMPSTDILANTQIWFTRVRPEPNDQHFHSQLGCHFEEIAEMCETLDGLDVETSDLLISVHRATHALAEHLKAAAKADTPAIGINNRVEFLDSICDQIVTGTGAAYCAKMDVINGMTAVNLSNYSKFGPDGQPIYDANMKMTKGPDYVPADLAPYV